MIEEMRKDIGKHHEAANQPDLADADASKKGRQRRLALWRANVNDRGCR
jgi:hypothetical protein